MLELDPSLNIVLPQEIPLSAFILPKRRGKAPLLRQYRKVLMTKFLEILSTNAIEKGLYEQWGNTYSNIDDWVSAMDCVKEFKALEIQILEHEISKIEDIGTNDGRKRRKRSTPGNNRWGRPKGTTPPED